MRGRGKGKEEEEVEAVTDWALCLQNHLVDKNIGRNLKKEEEEKAEEAGKVGDGVIVSDS